MHVANVAERMIMKRLDEMLTMRLVASPSPDKLVTLRFERHLVIDKIVVPNSIQFQQYGIGIV
ncbi:hypothetical protein SAMN04487954_102108 [Billgrantia gudaonensis]|uniref:Uncharacterized protein n=1 Tax=Billgrantia gudaonensis TaxID=376427 RepID=A0A1G8PKC5_9GAMM|nr:hypothetical protein SAMN04487954_102108 [Halomonas gudaonensis]